MQATQIFGTGIVVVSLALSAIARAKGTDSTKLSNNDKWFAVTRSYMKYQGMFVSPRHLGRFASGGR